MLPPLKPEPRKRFLALTFIILLTAPSLIRGRAHQSAKTYPIAELHPSTHLTFPGRVDSNSPAFWDGDTFYLFNSAEGAIKRSQGASLEALGEPQGAQLKTSTSRVNHWIEAVWKADRVLWGWYHAEPWDSICPNLSVLGRILTAPEIGAVVSLDNGLTWYDLGIILRANPVTLVCDTANGYFSGGVGDVSVMLDEQQEYLYFFSLELIPAISRNKVCPSPA